MSKEGTQGFAEPEGGTNVSKGPFLGSCWADVGMLVRYFTKSINRWVKYRTNISKMFMMLRLLLWMNHWQF